MDHYKETLDTWNKLASLYEERFMHLTIYNETYDLFCNSIETENPEILEIGCGPGNITRYLLDKRPDFKILATDIAPNMIELAKKNNPEATFSIMDCRNIDQIDKKFDGIVCGFCIPYISLSETIKLINDCQNLLKDNGNIYLSYVEGNKENSGFKTSSTGDRTFFNYYSAPNILSTLKINFFNQIKTMLINYERSINETEEHIVIIAKKQSII